MSCACGPQTFFFFSALTQTLYVREWDDEHKKEVTVFKKDVDPGNSEQTFVFQDAQFGVKLVPYLYMQEDGVCLCLLTDFSANDTVQQIYGYRYRMHTRVQTHSHTRRLLVEGRGFGS